MSTNTSIEWTEKTWNPVTGCTKVSQGCKHCYAEVIADRFWATQYPKIPYETRHSTTGHVVRGERARLFTDVLTHEGRLAEPLKWRKPARIFVNSMSDLFHENVPFEFIDRVFAVMALSPQHTFQVLTKRADRMRDYVVETSFGDRRSIRHDAIQLAMDDAPRGWRLTGAPYAWPLQNVWLGVSCENQETAEQRIPLLLDTPAAVKWVSAEPLLEAIDFTFAIHHIPALVALDWIVVGGESGPGARVFDIQWARNILAQCRTAGVWCFVKQLGSNPDNSAQPDGGLIQAYIKNRKGGDMAEWPDDLRVREYPSGT